ncbi:MAG TPA: DUF1572 family protein [Tepidisphaeraceae bacterium]|nr:DUF1572 family protein [Tepidisphaeraceae bacterium]
MVESGRSSLAAGPVRGAFGKSGEAQRFENALEKNAGGEECRRECSPAGRKSEARRGCGQSAPSSVLIGNEPHTILKALVRSSAQCVWHASQIALIAKHFKGSNWQYLTIPPGGSDAFNQARGINSPSISGR